MRQHYIRLVELSLVWFSLGVAVSTILLYMTGHGHLASWIPETVPMSPSTAIALLCLSAAVLMVIKFNRKD